VIGEAFDPVEQMLLFCNVFTDLIKSQDALIIYAKFANYFPGSQYHCLFLNGLKIDESYEIC